MKRSAANAESYEITARLDDSITPSPSKKRRSLSWSATLPPYWYRRAKERISRALGILPTIKY